MKTKYFFPYLVIALSLSSISFAYVDDFEDLQQQLPPFPQCSATCPAQYYGAGDTCKATGQPGQVVACGLELSRLGAQPDGTYRQACRAVCSVK